MEKEVIAEFHGVILSRHPQLVSRRLWQEKILFSPDRLKGQ
jgi:hypothetical protein